MKIVFFGSSKYSVIDEKEIHEKIGLSLVVTLPDRINYKTRQHESNPVKKYAQEHNIPVISTEKLTEDSVNQIADIQPDFLVVADFGLILPKKLLEIPKKAAVNVHQSLLPKYRGPAPVPFAILAGESTVGVTIMLIVSKVDAGDMLIQEKYEVKPDDTTDSILTKLNELGSKLVIKVLKNFDNYYKNRIPQNEDKATYSHYMKRDDGYIDSTDSLEIEKWKPKLDRMIRAYFPWPGVWTKWHMTNGKGRMVKFLPNKMLQVEGKKSMSYKDFMNGYKEGKELLEKLGLL